VSGALKFDVTFDTADLRAKLADLKAKLPESINRRALNAAAAVVRDRARELVPVRTGALKKSIISDTKRTRDRKSYYGRVTIKSGTYSIIEKISKRGKKSTRLVRDSKGKGLPKGRIRPRNYAAQVETGTASHSVRAGSTKKRPRPSKDKAHPGSRPQPFMRPAFQEKQAEAIAKYVEVARAGIAGIAAKPRQRKK
jgi:HK97 gp10 family phage protein